MESREGGAEGCRVRGGMARAARGEDEKRGDGGATGRAAVGVGAAGGDYWGERSRAMQIARALALWRQRLSELRGLVHAERLVDEGRVLVARRVVEILHRRLHVGVDHPLLHST